MKMFHKATKAHHGYPLLILAWAVLVYGTAPLAKINTLLAQTTIGVAYLLAGITTIVAIVHFWRYG